VWINEPTLVQSTKKTPTKNNLARDYVTIKAEREVLSER
jgi:hypothetical protein